MNAIEELIQKFKSYDVKEDIREAVNENAEEIADLNTEQLADSTLADESQLGEYASVTLQIKKTLGKPIGPGGRVNLNFDGDFYRSIKVKSAADGIEFTSADQKYDEIRRYVSQVQGLNDDEILGLTEESKAKVKLLILPKLKEGLLRWLRR